MGTAPINGAFDLHAHAIPQIEQLVWPRRQRLAAEGARFVHAFLAQLLKTRLAILVAARQLRGAGEGPNGLEKVRRTQ